MHVLECEEKKSSRVVMDDLCEFTEALPESRPSCLR